MTNLNAIDGQINGGGGADKFRKIWNKSNGASIYDNQLGSEDQANPKTVLVETL